MTPEERRKLVEAPIVIRHYGRKSWGGAAVGSVWDSMHMMNHRHNPEGFSILPSWDDAFKILEREK